MATSAQLPEQQASMNSFSRVVNVFFSPKETFADIARRPTWVLPLALVLLVSVIVVAAFGQHVGWRGTIEKQFASNKRIQQLSPAARETSLERATKMASTFGYAGVLVAIPLSAVIVAAACLGVFNLFGGARIQFNTAFGIVTHSWMPGVITGLLGLLVLFLRPPELVDVEHLVASNLGALVSGDAPKWLLALATSFDLFTFWTMILMAFGFAAASPRKITFGKALAFILVLWAAWVVVHVGGVALFS